MRILIIGAGVLGCNMAHNFYVAGKDITLFARGAWGQNIKERGLVIKNKFSLRSTCDKISVIDKLSREDEYDVIFVCLRYTQLCPIIDSIKENTTKNIVFVGNNMDAEGLASKLKEKTVMFAFASSAGQRTTDCVLSIDMKKITIGDLKTSKSNETFLQSIFEGTKYRVIYEANMGDYLLSHGAFIIPATLACYYTDGNLKMIKNDKDFIYKVIDANAECYEAIERLGHELLPKGEESYRLEKYRKRTYRFYKLLFSTVLGKICISDHAMNAADEMNVLAGELEKMMVSADVKADNFNELKKHINKYLG